MRLIILSLISGTLSYLSVSLPHRFSTIYDVSDDMLFFLPGTLFGLFILLPLVQKGRCRLFRWAILMIFSVGAWFIAVSVGFQVLPLVQQAPVIACGLSGSLGALLVAAISRHLIPFKFSKLSILSALIFGFLGGCIIGLAVKQPRASLNGELFYFVGFLFWQSSVAGSLFRKQPGPPIHRRR